VRQLAIDGKLFYTRLYLNHRLKVVVQMTRQFLSQMSLFDLKDRLVEHGDLLSELKRVQEGLVGGFERETKFLLTLNH